MKNLILLIMVLFVVCHMASSSNVYAQKKTDEITAEEKKAANELADRFIQRLDETGDIQPLTKEMFVGDFMERYVKERKKGVLAGEESPRRIFFAPGLEYDSALLDQASGDDWRQFYFLTFNFMQYGYTVMLNAASKYYVAGKEPDDDVLEQLLDKMYPPAVMKILDTNPILHNFVKKDVNSAPIKNIDELRNVNKTLGQGMKLLLSGDGVAKMKMTSDSKKASGMIKNKLGSELGPYLEVCDDECYGFAKGTRMVRILASATYMLLITKVGQEYKIVSAVHGSPD